jgi:hypothetical protein
MHKIKLDLDPANYGFIQFQIGDWTSPKLDVLQSEAAYRIAVQTSQTAEEVWTKWRAHLAQHQFPAALSTAALAHIAQQIMDEAAKLAAQHAEAPAAA